jgi:outer membrane protein OmpA-like peptidoglycan-associated protein
MGFVQSGCAKKDSPAQSDSTVADTSSSAAIGGAPASSGFDISKVPVVNPTLGKFPYVSLIEEYKPAPNGANKDVAFDRYEFFDGSKINTVEGRLATIEAEGQGSSAFEVAKTYESLIKGLGGVTVFEGTADKMDATGAKFSDTRHREPVYSGDQMGVYVVRTPEKDIWVETYVRQHGKEGTYFLTVVEKKTLEARAGLLAAEAMKKELDAKGHVALYINFDFDKATIKAESQPIIEQIVKLLKTNPSLDLTVEGHTDNVGQPAYNQRLSGSRAASVVAALTGQGIEARRLKAVGYGQDKPIADNSTDEGRAKNRRVELVKVP